MSGDEVRVSILPNPMSTSAEVKISQDANAGAFDVKLYDLRGRLVSDLGKTQNDTIHRGALAAGQYILRLSNSKSTTALRLEIQ